MAPRSLGPRLVEAIAARDEHAIAACFAEEAEFRALVPNGLREASGSSAAASLVAGWFANSSEFELVESGAEEVGDSLHVSYRFRGVREGEPYVIEQHLFCTVDAGTIERAHLLCSGFRPRPAG